MNKFRSLAIFSALLLGGFVVAHADSISGAFAATGADTFTNNFINFVGTSAGGGLGDVDGTVTTDTPTGTFLTYFGTGGQSINYFPAFPTGSALPYLNGHQSVPSGIWAPGQTGVELFTVTGGGETFNFYMTDYTATYTTATPACPIRCLTVLGDGYYIGSGAVSFTDSVGQFDFTSQYLPHQSDVTSFSASIDATPIPEPASLALFGTGLLGIVGVARRKLKV
jgi:hypothetical protein